MLRWEKVGVTYDGGRTYALRDLCLDVPAGSLLALVGESGCGKTTTLKTVNRLVELSEGIVHVQGRDVRSLDAPTLRRGIGYVSQGVGLFPHYTVGENVAVVPRLQGLPPAAIAPLVDELLTLVGLDPAVYRDRPPHTLSGGQRQRVGFARALAGRPPLLLMDEPFAALDPLTRDTLRDDFTRLRKSLDLTCVLVTHDMGEALLLADRVAVLAGGRVLREATPAELLRDAGDRYVERLLATPLRQADALRRLSRPTTGGAA